MEITKLLEEIYRKKYRLFVFIGKMHGLNYDAAFDAMQTAFVKALKKKDKILSMTEPALKGYIIAIMRNECRNYYRNERHYINSQVQVTGNGNILDNTADISLSPLDKVVLTEEKLLRDAAILKLSEKYREVVRLSLDGYKRKEIAQMLKQKHSNIQNLKHRGLKKYYSIIRKMNI